MPPSTNSTLVLIKQAYLDQYSSFKTIPENGLFFAKEAANNALRNRHFNVRPYQQNIFKFQNPSLYFNASCVLQGRAISCQGPLDHEHADFWRMVWESKTTAIVMLTDLVENGKHSKCSWYLPKVNGEKLPPQLNFSQELEITVTQIAGRPQPTATSTRDSIDERHLKLEYQGEKRTVVHYHLRGWGDFQAVPPDILAKLVTLVSERHFSKGEHILTHCSAGIGRSGTFLATLEAFTQLKNKPALTDLVFNVVQQLRSFAHGRVGMVQTVEQYGLIFKTLAVLDTDCAREFCVQTSS
ncbi:MAG TPA: protein-tyrosine phosphatase family protein [Rhabdochlamydiaceae bacterium]|nr:protein-tyrosine phosphatase family protein [Rhabdochlamydiaceae bacterium]